MARRTADDAAHGVSSPDVAAQLAALPEAMPARANADEIAVRLIALLPPRQVVSRPTSSTSAARNTGAPANDRIVVFLILMALLLGPQLLMRSAQPSAQVDGVHGSAHPWRHRGILPSDADNCEIDL